MTTKRTWKGKTKRKPTPTPKPQSPGLPIVRPLCSLALLSLVLLAGLAIASSDAFAIPSAHPSEGFSGPQSHHKPSPNDCLLYATVFTEDGYLLPGADINVHPAGKKKPIWEATSDRRGEFAVRVPPDGDYEIEVKAKGYIMQMQKVTAQLGERLDLVFHMPHQPAKK
jgi:hypothetical protein